MHSDPQNPDAYLYLGQMYFETNRSAEAETALRQCIRLTTDISRNQYQVRKAHFILGKILMNRDQKDAAQAEMDIARNLASRMLEHDKNKLAGMMDGAGAADVDVPSPVASSLTAEAAHPVALEKVEATREQFRLPLADSYNNLGAIAATNGDYADAVMYFQRAAMWNPALDGLDYNWGRAAFAGSQFADAIMPLSRYLKSHPTDTGARSVLGISQFMTGNYHGCLDTLQSVIEKTDVVPQVEYAYAESMIRTGQVDAGTKRLAALEKLHPEYRTIPPLASNKP